MGVKTRQFNKRLSYLRKVWKFRDKITPADHMKLISTILKDLPPHMDMKDPGHANIPSNDKTDT